MPERVAATDLQKNFGYWHDKAMSEPVQITKHGRETAYLVSADTFHELWASHRRAVSVRHLSEAELGLIQAAEIPEEHAYEAGDLEPDGRAADGSPPRSDA
jgi:antitoxin StbD